MESTSLPTADQDQDVALATSRRFRLPDTEVLIAGLLLLFAVAFNLYRLYPEVAIRAPLLNDGVLHRLAFERTVTALASGQDPTDPWLAEIVLGYPLFHHYQHLAYLLPALLSFPLSSLLDLPDLFDWTRYLLLCLFPLSIYWSMRRFGFGRLPAALAGLIAPLLATNGLYGLDFASYLWRGYGMVTQLWGMLLLPPALAQGYTALRTGRGYVWAVLLLAATMLSHLVFGYIAFLSLGLLALLPLLGPRTGENGPGRVWPRLGRLALLLVLVALVTAYFSVPFLLDRAYMNRSVWEDQGKYDAYGWQWTLGALVKGDLFDFGRFPSLTLLAGLGLIVCIWRWREERYRIPVVLALAWLLLYFGRPTWGVLLDLLPLSGDLHLHRLIAGVHLGGMMLMGVGLALPWQWALSRENTWRLLMTAALTMALLLPVYRERGVYLGENARWMAASREALAAEAGDLDALIETLRRAPPGRVYAGLGGNWGADYKVGDVPVMALLQSAGFDMLGYLYHALSLNADVQVLFDEGRPEQYNLFGVGYVVAPAGQVFPEFVQPLADFGRHRLYQVTSSYVDLVGSEAAFFGDREDFYPAASHWLASDLPRVGQHPALFLEGTPDRYEQVYPLSQAGEVIPLTAFPSEPSRGRVLSQEVGDNAYAVEVEVERESFLMLKATYHPNWQATVDGRQVETVMLMPSYVGVALVPGLHRVQFEYRPQPWRGILGLAGLLLLALIALGEWRREGLARWLRRLPTVEARSSLKQGAHRLAGVPAIHAVRASLAPHLPYLGLLALFTLLAGLSLFQFKIMSGHDALEYLPRATEFYEGLRAGQLFPRWAPDLSGGYGQPFFNFNPPLFYYVSALFYALGWSFVAAQNLALLVLLYAAGLGMYLLASEFFGPRGGLVAAVAYLFAPYLLVTLYVRHALADFSAFATIPWAFWGLYRFARDGRPLALFVGALSLALLLLSSNPVALVTFPALLLFLAWLAFAGRSGRVLLRGLWCLALGLGLSTFFWLPALAERRFVHLDRLLEGYLDYRYHFVYPGQFFHSPWGYGLSLPGTPDGMSFALGPVHLLLALAALLLIWRLRRIPGWGKLAVSFSLVLLLLAAFLSSRGSMFLWEWLPLLQYLEFPWRLLSLVAVSTALLCGFPFLLLAPDRDRLATALMAVLLAALFLFGFPQARPEAFLDVQDADYSPQAIARQGLAVTTANEYEPVWVQERPPAPATAPVTLVNGQARLLSTRPSPIHFEIQADVTEQARLQVSTFYFPGWTLYVDGVEMPVEPDNPQGLIEFSLEPGEHQVQVLFRDTPVRLWSTRLSFLALILLVFTPWLWQSARRS
ncbi:MAG TPA: YfhO family protein [Anaerolineae bacterium]|nr:YfhO family protein [Anaerolineae bacterium]